MSVASEITRIKSAVERIRTKLLSMGLGGASDRIDQMADSINSVAVYADLDDTVKSGGEYIIPRGFHDGRGRVTAEQASGAEVVEQTVAPSSNSQTIAFSGLSKKPTAFHIQTLEQFNASSTRTVIAVSSYASGTYGAWAYRQSSFSNATIYTSNSYFTWEYANGTLTVRTNSTTNGGVFASGLTYRLIAVV